MVKLNYRKQKYLMKSALMLFQLEMWKNELLLNENFNELIKKDNLEIPPNLGTAIILFKTCRYVDPDLYESIKKMDTLSALKEINKKWNIPDTEEDTQEFVEKGTVRKIEIPTEIEALTKKLEKGEGLTAEDLIEPPKINKKVDKDADMKVVKDGVFGEKKIVKKGEDPDKPKIIK